MVGQGAEGAVATGVRLAREPDQQGRVRQLQADCGTGVAVTQLELVPVVDSHVTDVAEQSRLTGQSARILSRLEQGPATNRELAEISLKYTSRVSDVRAYLKDKGRNVKVFDRDYATGLVWYGLVDL
jgi:hypothetical protein